MKQPTSKLNPDWVKQALSYFQEFLRVTKFPHPERELDSVKGRKFNYPEWLIMFIAILSVKAKIKRYLGIHQLALRYWDIMTAELPKEIQRKPISERQLRDRLKKSATRLEDLQHSFFKYFLRITSIKKVSADQMMVRAVGPVWHKKDKDKGVIPKGLRGLDQQATWAKSVAKGWVYGHGTFMLTSFKIPVVGIFQWMVNSANEAKRMRQEIIKYTKCVKKIFMDSKADDQKIYYDLKKNHQMQLITKTRKGMDKTATRQQMIKEMSTKQNQKDYLKRSTTVEPMQGLMDDIFDLDRCWMKGNDNNRWLFAAMGVAVQLAQLKAYKEKRSTWKIKTDVLGV